MPLVPLNCPLCSGVFQVDAAHAGSEVQCPLCSKTVQLPASLSPASEPSSPPSTSSSEPPQMPPAQEVHSFPAPPPMPGQPAAAASAPPPEPTPKPAATPAPSPAAPLSTAPDLAPTAVGEVAVSEAPPVPDTSRAAPATESDPAESLPRMTCAKCEHLFRVPLESAGSQVYCPSCNEIVDVPAVLVEAPEVPDAEPIVAPEFQFEDSEETADDIAERGGLRHLSREERAHSRARKNAVMLVVGFLLLFGSIFVLQSNEQFFMDLWEKYGAPPPEEKAGG